MTQIISLSGCKGSGKNTAANFLHGHVLKLNEVLKDFTIDKKGLLQATTQYIKDGEVQQEDGVMDLTRLDDLWINYADQNVWPIIKLYSFADALKEICVGLFGLTHEQAYGTYKNSPTKLFWENMPGVITPDLAKTLYGKHDEGLTAEDLKGYGLTVHENRRMTAREVLQYVGTEIFRKMHGNVWIDLLMEKIKSDDSEIAVIADCRFDNEAAAVKENGGILIKLTRNTDPDDHISENGFKDTVFDKVIDNANMSIGEAHAELLEFLIQRGVTQLVQKVSF